MRRSISRAAVGLLAPIMPLALTLGCGADPSGPDPKQDSSTASGRTGTTGKATGDDHEPPPAPPRHVLGRAGSGCELPLRFAIPSKWKPQKVDYEAEFEQGGYVPVCEVDAKQAGNLGIMRVWIEQTASQGTDTRTALETFLTDGAGRVEKPRYKPLEADTVHGTQATYTRFLPAVEERKKEAAFALPTTKGMTIVTLSGLDSEEYEEMLPAYVLAKTSVKVAD